MVKSWQGIAVALFQFSLYTDLAIAQLWQLLVLHSLVYLYTCILSGFTVFITFRSYQPQNFIFSDKWNFPFFPVLYQQTLIFIIIFKSSSLDHLYWGQWICHFSFYRDAPVHPKDTSKQFSEDTTH